MRLAPHNAAMKIRLFLGGLRPPKPSQGAGPGCAGLRPASAGAWGNPVSPFPSSRAYFHVSRPCGCAAQHRNEHKVVSGRAAPSQTLPGGGAWVRGPPARVRGGWGTPVPHPPARGLRPSRPSQGRGNGEPRFPIPRRAGCAPQTLLRVGVWGNPVSPRPSPGEGYALPNPPVNGHSHVRQMTKTGSGSAVAEFASGIDRRLRPSRRCLDRGTPHACRGHNAACSIAASSSSVKVMGLPCMLLARLARATMAGKSPGVMP